MVLTRREMAIVGAVGIGVVTAASLVALSAHKRYSNLRPGTFNSSVAKVANRLVVAAVLPLKQLITAQLPTCFASAFTDVASIARFYAPIAKDIMPKRLSTALYVCCVAPIYEELVKRAYGYYFGLLPKSVQPGDSKVRLINFANGFLFGAAEAYNNNSVLGLVTTPREIVVRGSLHGYAASQSLLRGCIYHICWNSFFMGIMISFLGTAPLDGLHEQHFSKYLGLTLGAVRVAPSVLAALSACKQRHGHLPIEVSERIVTDICCAEQDMKCAEVQDDFKMTITNFDCVPKHGATGYWGIHGFVGTVFRQCWHNQVFSLCGRVGKKLPMHEDETKMQRVLRNYRTLKTEFLGIMRMLRVKRTIHPMDFTAWSASFPPMRREMLRRIVRDAEDIPDMVASAFIKSEIAMKQLCDFMFKDPRWIQGCPPGLSARVGPYYRGFVHEFRDAFAPSTLSVSTHLGRQVYYTCGRNAIEIGEAFAAAIRDVTARMVDGDSIVFVEDDQSRFDLHLTQGAFELLSAVYQRYLPKAVAALLRRSDASRGVSHTGTRYKVPYTMQSGWPDTSGGDTAVNAAFKYKVHGFGRNWSSIICGDDSVTVTTTSELRRLGGVEAIIDAYAEFGMEVEVAIRYDPLDVEFCSARFYPTQHTYTLMPRPGKILSKICWDMSVRTPHERIVWLRSVASSLRMYGNVDPLLAALATMLERETGRGATMPLLDKWKYYVGTTPAFVPTDNDVSRYYDHHYGLATRDVRELVKVITDSRVGDFLTDSRLIAMAEHDL